MYIEIFDCKRFAISFIYSYLFTGALQMQLDKKNQFENKLSNYHGSNKIMHHLQFRKTNHFKDVLFGISKLIDELRIFVYIKWIFIGRISENAIIQS